MEFFTFPADSGNLLDTLVMEFCENFVFTDPLLQFENKVSNAFIDFLLHTSKVKFYLIGVSL